MLVTGEFIDARTALAWGLVNDVVPAAELQLQAAELAAEALARPALAADRHDPGPDLDRSGRRAVIDVAGDGDRRPDPGLDRPHDLQDPLPVRDDGVDPVAGPDPGRGLGRRAVHPDMAALAELRRQGSGPHETDRAEPAVDARGVGCVGVGCVALKTAEAAQRLTWNTDRSVAVALEGELFDLEPVARRLGEPVVRLAQRVYRRRYSRALRGNANGLARRR